MEIVIRDNAVTLQPEDTWENAEGATIIRSAVLSDLAERFGEVTPDPVLIYGDRTIGQPYAVFQCSGHNSQGRHYSVVGEASPETTSSDIGRYYVFTMAHKRAKDNWNIAALGLEGKVYSSNHVFMREKNGQTRSIPQSQYEGDPFADSDDTSDTAFMEFVIPIGKYQGERLGDAIERDGVWFQSFVKGFKPNQNNQVHLEYHRMLEQAKKWRDAHGE